jgi:hypothetical protein
VYELLEPHRGCKQEVEMNEVQDTRYNTRLPKSPFDIIVIQIEECLLADRVDSAVWRCIKLLFLLDRQLLIAYVAIAMYLGAFVPR